MLFAGQSPTQILPLDPFAQLEFNPGILEKWTFNRADR
jgi:hypothetical protein